MTPHPTPHPPRTAAPGVLAPHPRHATAPAPAPDRHPAPARSFPGVRDRMRSDPLAAPAWVAALALAGMCCAAAWWTIRTETAIWRAGRAIDSARERMAGPPAGADGAAGAGREKR